MHYELNLNKLFKSFTFDFEDLIYIDKKITTITMINYNHLKLRI